MIILSLILSTGSVPAVESGAESSQITVPREPGPHLAGETH